MKITFIVVGTLKASYLKDAVSDYFKRISRYIRVDVVEVREASGSAKTPKKDSLRDEAERILRKLSPGDAVVVCADAGKEFTSKGLASFVEGHMTAGCKTLVFIVGGAYGLDPGVMEAADIALSLSRMTLPHDLARLVLFEQVYRAFTIIKGEPYSH
ncbi:MAG: 23S rRNA (pseudouridine(1915)-N(3))-methyltransferase RlmH [Deltaproteobacteria bacterium]|nr:23S rRNA (pseudouridine(1915)-N(3))-methyltransferase RlmH [Deltaproteobacteria bacterium]